MALDTAAKRFSMLGGGVYTTLPPPDGALVAGDRLHLLGLYGSTLVASDALPALTSSATAAPSYGLRLYDARSGQLAAFLPKWMSLTFRRRAFEAGTWSLQVHEEQIDSDLVLSDPVLSVRRDGTQVFSGISRKPHYDEVAGIWTLGGMDLKWFLAGRTILPPAFDPVDEVQQWHSGTPTAGVFRIAQQAIGQTADIAWDAGLATIQAAVNAALEVGETLTVSGALPSAGGPLTFSFGGALGGRALDLLRVDGFQGFDGERGVTRVTAGDGGPEHDSVAGMPAESAMLYYARRSLGDEALAERRIDGELDGISFTIPASLGRGPERTYNARYVNLLQALKALAGSDIWYEVERLDSGYRLALHEVEDRSSSTPMPVIFSVARGNVAALSWERDRLGTANTLYVLGQGQGTQRRVVIVQSAEAATDWRREGTLDSRNNDSESSLEADGAAKLANDLLTGQKVQLELSPAAAAGYGVEWELGMIVTVAIPRYGIEVDRQIVEVAITVERDGLESMRIAVGDRPLRAERKLAAALQDTNRVQVA